MASGLGNGCWGGKVIFRNGGSDRSRDGGSSRSDRSNMFLATKGQLSFFLHSVSFSFFRKSDAALKVLKTYPCFR